MTGTELAGWTPAVARLARRFAIPDGSGDRDDLVQIGLLAVWQASRDFDPDRGLNFAQYALAKAAQRMIDQVRLLQPGGRRHPQPAPVSLDEPEAAGWADLAAPGSLDVCLEARLACDELRRMRPKDARPLVLRLAGYRLDEIGARCGYGGAPASKRSVACRAVRYAQRRVALALAA